MTRPLGTVLAVAALAAFALAACGHEQKLDEIAEGEPVELGDLRYNVLFTRFLNSSDVEDRDYLTGQPPAPSGKSYLAIFLQVENEGEEGVRLPDSAGLAVTDTTGAAYSPLPSQSLFAFPFGSVLEPGEELPRPDTVAASGPIQGAMVLYLVDLGVTENRPLELEMPSPEGDERALIELDI